MTQSQSTATISPSTSLPAPLRSSDNTGRLSAGQYGVVVRLLSGGRQGMCVLLFINWIVYRICTYLRRSVMSGIFSLYDGYE
jgi:hypothetical protein